MLQVHQIRKVQTPFNISQRQIFQISARKKSRNILDGVLDMNVANVRYLPEKFQIIFFVVAKILADGYTSLWVRFDEVDALRHTRAFNMQKSAPLVAYKPL